MPLIDLTQAPGTVAVWLAPPAAAALFNPVDQTREDQHRWASLRGERRRLDWMVSRALLAGVSPRPGLPVSLSHSHGHAALAIAEPGFSVGVDLEFVRQRDAISIARMAFSPRECADLEGLHERARLKHFYALWTLKEACAKALKIDLQHALRACQIWRETDGWHASAPTSIPWSADVFSPSDDLMLAIVRVAGDDRCAPTGGVLQHEWPRGEAARWERVLGIQFPE